MDLYSYAESLVNSDPASAQMSCHEEETAEDKSNDPSLGDLVCRCQLQESVSFVNIEVDPSLRFSLVISPLILPVVGNDSAPLFLAADVDVPPPRRYSHV